MKDCCLTFKEIELTKTSSIVQINRCIVDDKFRVCDYDCDTLEFSIDDKILDGNKIIVEKYKIYPTFEYDSGIEIYTKNGITFK